MSDSAYSILNIYASTTDKIGSKLLYEHIVHQAKSAGISGLTVYRGIMGFGMSSKIVSSKFWELTEKLPVKIEMIDTTLKLEEFYQSIEDDLQGMKKGCLAVIEPVTVKLHKPGD